MGLADATLALLSTELLRHWKFFVAISCLLLVTRVWQLCMLLFVNT